MKKLLKNVVKTIFPQHMQLWLTYNHKKLRGSLDPEMLFVERNLTQHRRFLDIGANVGIYSFTLHRLSLKLMPLSQSQR